MASAPPAEGAQGSPHQGLIRPLRPYVMADDSTPAPAAAERVDPAVRGAGARDDVPFDPGHRPVAEPGAAVRPEPDRTAAAPAAGFDDGEAQPAGRSSLALRPFLLTAGRVAGGSAGSSAVPPLPLETQLVTTAEGLAALSGLTFERQAIVAACRVPLSLAELAARLHLHLNVVRVIAGDLHSAHQLAVYIPQASTAQDVSVLRRVIDGLRAVPDSRGLPRGNRPA